MYYSIKTNVECDYKNNISAWFIKPSVEVSLEKRTYQGELRVPIGSDYSKEAIVAQLAERLALDVSKLFLKSLEVTVNKDKFGERYKIYSLTVNVVTTDEKKEFEAREKLYKDMAQYAHQELGYLRSKYDLVNEELQSIRDKSLWKKILWLLK